MKVVVSVRMIGSSISYNNSLSETIFQISLDESLARALPADVLILDLEDAVAPDAKATARNQVADAVKAGGFGKREMDAPGS